MRGLLTALENISTPIVLVTSVDMPLIGGEQLLWLMKVIEDQTRLLSDMQRGRKAA